MDDKRQLSEQFVQHLTGCQHWLYAYILSLLPDSTVARDVLQQANVAMCRKSEQFVEGTNFDAWACRIAYFEVLTARRDHQRDRHLYDDKLLSELASDAQSQISLVDERMVALEDCLDLLSTRDREVVRQRYSVALSVKQIGEDAGRKAGTVATSLHRIRLTLMKCIDRRLSAGARQ